MQWKGTPSEEMMNVKLRVVFDAPIDIDKRPLVTMADDSSKVRSRRA